MSGQLHEPAILRAQTMRLLRDPKSKALVTNFAGQWLMLRDLKSAAPDTRGFDENLRRAMSRETEMFFESIIREDRSIRDLLDADYTFVDERLARHYGIPGVRGDRFRRVALSKDDPRRGLLGKASLLLVTSVTNRTSPVARGKWILENLLGVPAPLPPPNIPALEEQDKAGNEPGSIREKMELHRANPACASCHKIMDPIGFSLENFDLVGRWRTVEGKSPINASGQLVDGTQLNGPDTLRSALLSRFDSGFEKPLGETVDIRIGAGHASIRHAIRPSHHPRCRQGQLQILILDPGRRKQRYISNAPEIGSELEGALMFISKRHLDRRTFLRGTGVCVALPLLESMVPAQTPVAKTAAASKSRLSCIYVPHGATMDKWTPATEGKGFAFTEILAPLEKYRDRINVISNTAHANAAGVNSDAGADHTRSAAVFLSGAHPQKERVQVGTTIDQIFAQKLGQDTPLPSIEMSIEEVALSCGAGYACAYANTISGEPPRSPCRWRTIRR